MERRVLHVLPSVRGYGAERQIVELLPLLQSGELTAGLVSIYEPAEEERARLEFPFACARRKSRRDYLFLPRLTAEIRRFHPHIVHTHTHVGKYWGRVAARLAGVSVVVHTEHNPCDPRRTLFERVADGLLLPHTNCIVTFFGEQRAFLAEREGTPLEKISVIPNGIALPQIAQTGRQAAREALNAREDQLVVFLVGRMEFQKNHVLALHALAAMSETARRRVVLHFLGAGQEEPLLRALTRELGLEERVRFLGYRTDVRQLMPGADLLLMTSWFEGMPLTLVEAMIAGVPIVTTPWTGASSMLGDGRFGFITPGWASGAVSSELQRALSLPAARAAMADRARAYVVKEFGIDRMADAHRRLYSRLVPDSVA